MTATESNFQLWEALSYSQRVDFFPYMIGFMGDALDSEAFAQAFVAFCQEPSFRY